jgi:DNA-binding PadR family transcriptional regulator
MAAAERSLNATAASLLGFLETEPLSGYDLAGRIDTSVGRFWNTTQSQIYRELAALAERGLIRAGAAGARSRTVYSITGAGRTAFKAWIEQMPGELITRFPLLLAVFFADRLPPGRLAEILRFHRAVHEELVREYERRLPAIERSHPYRADTMRFGIEHARLVISWIDSVAAREKRSSRTGRTHRP